jgi:hypothetical protein
MRSVAAIVLAFISAVPANTSGQSSGTGSGREHSNSVTSAAAQQREEQFRYTNRLIHSNSPYLLLYAHNPVDWYLWVTKAFEKARRENKPIFLSIGYFTCHWCHVMERESSRWAVWDAQSDFFSPDPDPPVQGHGEARTLSRTGDH